MITKFSSKDYFPKTHKRFTLYKLYKHSNDVCTYVGMYIRTLDRRVLINRQASLLINSSPVPNIPTPAG
jgi:hypothetical protein